MVDMFGGWTVPLCLMGVLYMLGGACWFWVDPTKKLAGGRTADQV